MNEVSRRKNGNRIQLMSRTRTGLSGMAEVMELDGSDQQAVSPQHQWPSQHPGSNLQGQMYGQRCEEMQCSRRHRREGVP